MSSKIALIAISLFFFAVTKGVSQCNCNFTIPAGSGIYTFDGIASGVKPGNVICLAAGARDRIIFKNVNGSASNYVKIINCNGQAKIGGPSVNQAISFARSRYFKLSGTGDSATKYGISIVGSAPGTQGVHVFDLSSDCEIDHLEVTKTGFAGIMAKSDPSKDCSNKIYERPNFTMSNVVIHDNYIHDITGEGIYAGNSFYSGATNYCGTRVQYPHEVRGVKIYNNIFDNCGWESIQLGAAVKDVEIHDNKIYNYGAANVYAQNGGIQVGVGSTGKVYNNFIKKGTGIAIFVQGLGDIFVHNNVIVNSGTYAILMSLKPTPLTTDIVPKGFLGPVRIMNNTIVNPTLNDAVVKESVVGPAGNVLYNNLIVGGQSTWLKLRGDTDWKTGNNVYIPSLANAKFVNTSIDDYRLLAGSPAINVGKDVATLGVTTDFDNKIRPLGGAWDVGAFEFSGNTATPIVNAGVDRTITLPTNTLTLTGTASDTDGTIKSLTWTKQSGPAAILSGTTTASLIASGLSAGTYVFRLTVADNSSLTAYDEVVVTVKTSSTTVSSTVLYRVNAGGSSSITSSPKNWIADTQSAKSAYLDAGSLSYTTGSSSWSGSNNTGAPNSIFGQHRYSTNGTPMQWNFPASSGTYEVSLFFAETPTSLGVKTAGARVFSVKMEGTTVLSNFDIYATAGMSAVKKVFQVTVSDGTLDIDFIRGIGNPQVNGIEVVLKSSGTIASRMADETAPPVDEAAQEKLLESSLDVYPNPFKDQINIAFGSDQKDVHVTLVDIAGQLVFKQVFTGLSIFTVDVSQNNLAPGMYILSLTTERGKIHRKVLKE